MANFGSSRDAAAKRQSSLETPGISTPNQYVRNDWAGTVGRTQGLVVTLNQATNTIDISAGEILVEDGTGNVETVQVAGGSFPPPDPDSDDHLYQVFADPDGLIRFNEISFQTFAYPTNIRSSAFLGIVFYNGDLGIWTVRRLMSVEGRRPGSTAYGIGYVIGPRSFRFELPRISGAGNKQINMSAGAIFSLGCNRQIDETSPHTFVSPDYTPVTFTNSYARTVVDTFTFFQAADGKLETQAGDNLWTKRDDNSGIPKNIKTKHWAIMPVFASPLSLVGSGPDDVLLPVVQMSQVEVSDLDFRRGVEVAVAAAIQSAVYSGLAQTMFAVIGAIAMREDALDTNDPDLARFFQGDVENLTGLAMDPLLFSLGNAAPKIVDEDSTIRDGEWFGVDTTAGPVTITVDPAAEFIRLFDSHNQWNNNDCIVEIGSDTYVLDKRQKEYSFFIDPNTQTVTNWYEQDKKVQ